MPTPVASTPGYPLGLPGATAATRYVGATASAAPASGTFAVGDFCIDQTGKLFVCTVAGSPGAWVQAGGGGGVPTEPVGSPVAWYNAAEVASLTIASDRVSAWADLTGNGHHMTQGTAADRPFYSGTPRTINSVVCPEFTATVEWLDSTCPDSDRTASYFIVFAIDIGATTLIGSSGGTGGFEVRPDVNLRAQYLKAGVAFLTSHVGYAMHGGPGLPQAPTVLCARMDATTLYQNLWECEAFTPAAEATTFTADRFVRLGADQSGVVPFDGIIAEFIYYDTKLSDADMYDNMLMLYNRWLVP